MRIVHINTFDLSGGAALAAWRLHEGLLAKGQDSRMLTRSAESGSERVATIAAGFWDHVRGSALRRLGYLDIHLRSSYHLREHPWIRAADVIHIHNLHGDYFNFRALPKLCSEKAVVWTLHDMWPLTGHCAYSFECQRWHHGCGRCPHLDTYPAVKRDVTSRVWRLRQRVYRQLSRVAQVAIISPSTWLVTLARQGLLQIFPIHHVPYGIDLDEYRRHDQRQAREALGLPTDKRCVLSAAASFESMFKGFPLLVESLERLPSDLAAQTELWILGSACVDLENVGEIRVRNLGFNGGTQVKRAIMSAADVMVLPSRADNLPLVLQEAMACALPMVGFAVGGVPDLIRDGDTGFLARPANSGEFASQLARLLSNRAVCLEMGRRARELAEREFELSKIVTSHLSIYRDLIGRRGSA